MKSNTPLLKTLLVAAATLSFCATPAFADGTGTGTQDDPYTGSISNFNPNNSEGTAGSTVYIKNITGGNWAQGSSDALTISSNLYITYDANDTSKNGITLTNGYSGTVYTFSGSISGSGNWTFNNSSVSQRYVFLGDMSEYSGNIDYSGERHDNSSYPSYFYFGNGGTAATDTNVSGTGSITHNETVIFNYSGYATQGSTAITIGNSSITAEYLTFTGSVNYNVSSKLTGYSTGSNTLTISNTGTTTLNGEVSGFGSITVASGATLAVGSTGSLDLTGTTVTLASAISNSGSITVDSSTSFVIDGMEMGTYSDGKNYYIVIDGSSSSGSITDGNTLSSSNFSGGGVNSSWNVYTQDGYLVIYGEATQDLTWTGSSSNTWDTTSENWSGGSTFKSYDNVTFNGTGSSTITLGENITAGIIDITGSGSYTISNGTGSGSGTSLSASSLTVETDRGITTTIDVSTLTIDGTLSIKPVSTDSSGNNPRVLVIGDGQNATEATAGSLFMQGDSKLQIAANSTLTVDTVTDTGGFDETISGEGTFIVTGTVTHSNGHDLTISIADFQAVNFSIESGGSATFSGANSKITGTLQLGSSGDSVTYTGSGTHTVNELLAHTTATVSLDYSNLTGSLTITKVDFGASGTLEINGNANGTITEISFTNGGVTLEVNGTVNVGTMNITTDNDTPTINIAEGATLNVTTMNVYPGGFGSGYYTTVSGAGADKSTFITGSLTIGQGTKGAGLEVKNTTFITGGITFSKETSGGMFYLYLDDVTLGFTQETVTIEASTGNSYIELGDHGSGSDTGTTDVASTTTINTNKYDTTTGAFTDTGVTVTIAEAIAGTGTLAVTGNGSLTLSGANTYSGGTVIDAGKVIAANNSALGTGDVTIENGGQLEVGEDVTISNNINIILSTENMSSSPSPNSVMTAYAADSDVYALIGEGSIASGVTITITVDEAVAKILAEEGEYTFNIYDSGLTVSNVSWVLSALDQYEAYWNSDTGQLTLRGIPEPSMFGLFFGLGALGLVATRRRRKVA